MTNQASPDSAKQEAQQEQAELARAYEVYSQHHDIIAKVLRSSGRWSLIDGFELAQDFLTDRLPKALRSYNPDVGPIEPWLYRVFLNYAKRRQKELVAHQTRHQELNEGQRILDGRAESNGDASAVLQAFDRIPPDFQAVIRAYFGPGNGSIRAVAAELDTTRYRAEQSLYLAINAVVQQLESDSVSQQMKLISTLFFEERLSWERISARVEVEKEEAQQAVREIVALCAKPFKETFLADPSPENSNDTT